MPEMDFDATAVPSQNLEILPKGRYRCSIKSTELKKSKAGDQYMVMTWRVLDGRFKGRLLWDQLHLWHRKSAPAREIAQSRLADTCRACGRPRIKRTEELHDIPCLLQVDVEDGRDGYDAKNRIRGVYPDQADKKPGAGIDRPTRGSIEAAGSMDVPPWERDYQTESPMPVPDGEEFSDNDIPF